MSLIPYGEGSSSLAIPVAQLQEETVASKWTVIAEAAEDCTICYDEPKTLHKMNCCAEKFIHLGCLKRHFDTGSNECPFCKHKFADLTNTRVAIYTEEEIQERSEPVVLNLYATDILAAMNEANTRTLVRNNNVNVFATNYLNQARQQRIPSEKLTQIAEIILTTIDPSISSNRQNRFLEAIRENTRAPAQAHQAPVQARHGPVRVQAAAPQVDLPTALEQFIAQLSNETPVQTCLTAFLGKIRHLNLTERVLKQHLSNAVFDSPFLTNEAKATFIEALANFQPSPQQPAAAVRVPPQQPAAAVRGPRQANIVAQEQRHHAPQQRANSFCSTALIIATVLAIASMATAIFVKENNLL